MKVSVEPGLYVLAVSGGVDSMSLLHALSAQPGVSLVVAHFDHGIREDSAEDRKIVYDAATELGVPFVFEEGRLGAGASEATARKARYQFLHRLREGSGAQAIITAHHQDDLLETAIINILRGTGRKGLSSLGSQPGLLRPLLATSKQSIREYARDNQIVWREDSTNLDTSYLRNYVRQNIIPKFDEQSKQQLYKLIEKTRELNAEIEELIYEHLNSHPSSGVLSRSAFIKLPHIVSREVMAEWLRANGLKSIDRKLIERLVVSAKTAKPGRTISALNGYNMHIERHNLALEGLER